MDNKKLITSAGHLDTALRAMEGFMKAFAIVFAVFFVLVKLFGEKMAAGTFSLDLDYVKLHLVEAYGGMPSGLVRSQIEVILIVGLIGCIFLRYGIGFLRRILAPMKEGRPFDAEVPVCLKKFAWVLLAGSGLIQVVGLIERAMLIRALPMEEIFSSPAIDSVEYVFTMDFGFVWVFVVLQLLARVFEYGQRLQQESDETL